jgi:hypothetical protein
MKKIVSVTTLGAALISVFAATAASADGAKHFGHGPAVYRPAYVAPAPVRYVGHHHSRGYWHNGRWIAPVVIGGVALAAASSYYYNTAYVAPTTYYAPAPVAVSYAAPYYASPSSVNYAAPAPDAFAVADTNGDGVLSYQEATVYPHWQRNFGTIDRNRDGFLTRDEVGGWRTH